MPSAPLPVSGRRCVSRAGLAQRIRDGREDESGGYQEGLSLDRHRDGGTLSFIHEAEGQVTYRGFTGEGAARSIRALLEVVAATATATARGPEPFEHRGSDVVKDDGLRHEVNSVLRVRLHGAPISLPFRS